MCLFEACDGVEMCELTGIFMLSLMEQTHYLKDIRLFTIPFIISDSFTEF